MIVIDGYAYPDDMRPNEPKVVSVTPLPKYMLSLVFENGERRVFDVKPYLQGEWYSQLLSEKAFRTVHVAGISIEWDGGQDIAPDDLYSGSVPCDGA